ncbi:MAG TPA: ATP synthase F0 subunit B [Phycisphaerales bacterium]|nr:ATP synthase F0 subunit B [Phycisphaerales bacterium]
MVMRVGLYVILSGLLLSASVSAQTEAESSPSVFEGYIGESIWTLIWFMVLLLVLWRFAWKPILVSLNLRQEHIEREIADAEKMRTEAQKVLSEYHAKLSDADRQGREIISVRVKEAEKQAMEVQQAKQREIEQMMRRAEAELQRDRQDAEEALWQQAGEIVRQLGREVFGKSLNEQDNQKLIDQAIAHLRSLTVETEMHHHS